MMVQQIAGGIVHWGQLPVYLVAEFVGALPAGLAYAAVATARHTTRRAAAVPAVVAPEPEGARP